ILRCPRAPLGSLPRAVHDDVDGGAALIRQTGEGGVTRIEATPTGVVRWTHHVKESGEGLLFNEIDSWMTGVNRNVEGKQTRKIMRYSGGHPTFREHCDAVAATGYREVALA